MGLIRGNVAATIGFFLLLGGCANQTAQSDITKQTVALEKPSVPPAPAPPAPQPELQPAPQTAEIFPGNGRLLGTSAGQDSRTDVTDDDEITLNFVNVDIRDVAKAVLGDFLNENYMVAANVQGNVTIQTSAPLARADVLPLLEQSLRLNGLALIKSNGLYNIVPANEAAGQGIVAVSGPERNKPGFGIQIVPLRYASATEMQKILEPVAPPQGILRVDTVRNILILQGTEQERAAMLEMIGLFDVDWLSGMSYALYTPQFTDAQGLAQDLNSVLGGSDSPIAGVVRLVPIQRLNAVLAISSQVKYLEDLKTWVERLDRPAKGADRRLYVYHVQNGRAADLSKVLERVFTSDGSAGTGSQTTQNGTTPSARSPQTQQTPPTPGGSFNAPDGQSDIATVNGAQAGMTLASTENISITAEETNNALVILATPAQYANVQNALHELDTVPMQVLMEAVIAEVTLTNDLRFGVQYSSQFNSRTSVALSNSDSSDIASTFPGFSYAFTDGADIKIVLDALEDLTHIEVLSSPELLVLNNQTATLQVGDQIPIITAQSVSTTSSDSPVVNSVQYHDTGVILKVTPRVNKGGMVLLDISQEVSDVTTTTTSTIDSPTISQRKIESTVAVQDGETIALGGLIRNNSNTAKSGIPGLQDVPLLGYLFSSTTDNTTRTELIVLVTPHVVDSIQKARQVTDELRDKMPAIEPLFSKKQ